MIGLFKKRVLHSRMLVLVGIPTTVQALREIAANNGSDFVRSLKATYHTDDMEIVASEYSKSLKVVQQVLQKIEKRGATIVNCSGVDAFRRMADYDIVVVIAHHATESDHVEFQGNLVSSKSLVAAIPEGCRLMLDMTSCYSSHLIPFIKARIPESRIIGIDVATSLPFRMFVLEEVVNHLCDNQNDTYLEALQKVLQRMPSGHVIEAKNDSVHLGSELRSTVFAPAQVKRGDDFMVQLFLHHSEDSEEIEIMARMVDEDAVVRNTKTLRVKLEADDRVDVELIAMGNNDDSIAIDEPQKSFYWDGGQGSVEFCVSIGVGYAKNSFMGKVRVAVNKEPVGDMLFKTEIVDKDLTASQKEVGTEVRFEPYDKEKECEEATASLKNQLEKQLHYLRSRKDSEAASQQDISVCEKCLELIQQKMEAPSNHVLKVFISSTSDMVNFRQVLREQIESCEMYPDMYENWGQDNRYPRDFCCSHVLDSDIFVLILGPKYGYVEPAWGLSMTEIEYLTAMHAGKPILVYVLTGAREKAKDPVLQTPENSFKQLHFIDDLSSKRMVGMFSNEVGLSLLAVSELLTIKHKIQKNGTFKGQI